ncbi:hypothetical protein L227DRAFT_569683 [Lentinus tigrinus ALCF2SS1-6]|uniref:Uncharacterized protein n=1 Tax=Lentinus tigrinus ALCF2SS1-6 TaxID=1328759 RepID=A0A5C2SWJ9_9APHY|nr:hypothetical protein L227DRAFT_569683 [Lentinus tigrinus ALCF2SS1-6]
MRSWPTRRHKQERGWTRLHVPDLSAVRNRTYAAWPPPSRLKTISSLSFSASLALDAASSSLNAAASSLASASLALDAAASALASASLALAASRS